MDDHVEPVKGISNRISQLIENQSQADRRFFDQNPRRAHLVRLAHPAEIAEGENALHRATRLPEGYAWYVAVRCVAPGMRLRAFFAGLSGFPSSHLTEPQAEQIYEAATSLFSEQAREIEACLREVAK
jgi:hypothetical protein